jgi:ribose transport system permease protein
MSATDQTTTPDAVLAPAHSAQKQRRSAAELASRLLAPLVLGTILLVFSLMSSNFLQTDNLLQVLNQSAILALAAAAMTIVVRAGGIDLSIGVSLDLGALAAAALIADGYVPGVALVGGVLFGLTVGLVNAFLIVVLRIRAFLATLSMWFIGTSLQQVLSGGGAPIYLPKSTVPDGFAVLGNGTVGGLPVPVLVAIIVVLVAWMALDRSRWGRVLTAAGEQPSATRIAGRLTGVSLAGAYVLASALAALAGVILASRTYGFIPASGQLYVLDAIGAVFIGATLSKLGRPNLLGTMVGVLIFALLANGMNLIGLSFYWQGLARGSALLLVLLISVVLARHRVTR